jgi:hypothetical protein
MNNAEYFRRAQDDSGFRQKKLDDQRHYKNANLGLLAFSVAVCGGFTIYSGLRGGGWGNGFTIWLPLITLTTCMHCLFQTRIAALEAMGARNVANPTARGDSSEAPRSV